MKEYQLLDIAFDINQEVKIDKDIVIKASNWLKEKGLNVSVSSIHINAWFGDYNKVTTSLSWFKKYDIKKEKCSFIGDSCNDEPMFEAFEETAGVANITKVLDSLTHKPKYITHNNGGFGFVEFANSLI
ncbi:MAG: HAD hydrolase family protein [Arcobacter sp.]|nr:HAD hydrolase family protein [Arcobacter sp.]